MGFVHCFFSDVLIFLPEVLYSCLDLGNSFSHVSFPVSILSKSQGAVTPRSSATTRSTLLSTLVAQERAAQIFMLVTRDRAFLSRADLVLSRAGIEQRFLFSYLDLLRHGFPLPPPPSTLSRSSLLS